MGLFGGRNIPADSLTVVRATVWTALDYGRGVANSEAHRHVGIAKQLGSFQIKTLREVLGVSDSTPILGVLGETGDLTDKWRGKLKQILLAQQMYLAPEESLPKEIARAALDAGGGTSLFARVNRWLSDILARPTVVSSFRKRSVLKKVVMKAARTEWIRAVQASERLKDTYAPSEPLRTRGYLDVAFRGRRVLTKLRVDDLNLGAAGYKTNAPSQQRCALCNTEPETRRHFTVTCTSLSHVRERHEETMRLTCGLGLTDAFRTLILARPPGATENRDRAVSVGSLLHDLWDERCRLLGIRVDM